MATVNQPCICTREDVRRALDVKQSSYTNSKVDRAICAATDAVEGLTQRKFYPLDTTRKWDWPNFQYSYPWKLWLDSYELAAPPTLITTGSLLPVPIVIPINNVILHPVNEGPPFTRIELRRDLNSAFGYNTTPQLDIAITGTYGYWMKTRPAGTLAASVAPGDLTITVGDGDSVGVGDVAIIDSERMIVTDSQFIDTTISYSGLSSASAKDNIVMVADGTKFTTGEVVQVDSEWFLILSINGNSLVVKRAWDGSILSEHGGGTLYARRKLSVIRGALGTTAASHSNGAAIVVNDVPALAKELGIAEALVWLTQEPNAYGGASAPQKAVTVGRGGFNVSEPPAGAGLPDLRDRVMNNKITRKARTRVILWAIHGSFSWNGGFNYGPICSLFRYGRHLCFCGTTVQSRSISLLSMRGPGTMADLDVSVDLSGPIITGMAEVEVDRFRGHLTEVLGDMGVNMIVNYLETQYMYLGHHGGTPKFNPVPANAGWLQSNIHTERQMDDVVHIVDDPVIYGDWIEGISSWNLVVWPHKRNPPPRRFPGYHAFRKITASLNAIASPVAYRELPVYIKMMNGV